MVSIGKKSMGTNIVLHHHRMEFTVRWVEFARNSTKNFEVAINDVRVL